MGKSAQLGLHTWLPDAMEGPTPVSALIHAATMVTAGVFMVCRLSPMFEYAPDAKMVVAIVGAATAFFAATVGLVQNDIKRVIAYSTCSQLGYMFFAAGVGAYGAAMFHLFTHAFFKALLFLCAGSVIHAMSDEQDMRKMGGIWKLIPYTYALMWIGSLALGRHSRSSPAIYSKDIILESAFAAHTGAGTFAFWLGVGAAMMTAFYSWRLLFMTFHGETRADHETYHHVHESPWVMLVPLIVLAVGAVFAGWLVLRRLRRRAHGSVLGRLHPVRRGQRGAAPRARGSAVGEAGAAGGRHRRHRARLRVLHVQDRHPGQAGRRDGRAVPLPAQQVVFRRAVRGDSGASRRRSSASACGRAATARSSTASAPMASPAFRRTSPSRRPGCSPATSITTPSRC